MEEFWKENKDAASKEKFHKLEQHPSIIKSCHALRNHLESAQILYHLQTPPSMLHGIYHCFIFQIEWRDPELLNNAFRYVFLFSYHETFAPPSPSPYSPFPFSLSNKKEFVWVPIEDILHGTLPKPLFVRLQCLERLQQTLIELKEGMKPAMQQHTAV